MHEGLVDVREVDLRMRPARPDRVEGGVGAGHDARLEWPGTTLRRPLFFSILSFDTAVLDCVCFRAGWAGLSLFVRLSQTS